MRKTRYRGVKTLLVNGPAGAEALREPPAASQDNRDRPHAAACTAFLTLWTSVRDKSLVPEISRFCAALGSPFAATTSIVELKDNAAVVRFQGEALIARWGRDLTGEDIYATFPHYARSRALANITRAAAHPCGYFGVNRVTVPNKGPVASHFIQLPLLSEDGATSYITHFSVEQPPDDNDAPQSRYYRSRGTGWIDIGAGIPARRPFLLDAPRAANG